jgi:RNA polymerase sigma-54 factor
MWMGLRLLSMPSAELKDAVRKEIESNPALEEVRSQARLAGAVRGGAASARSLDTLADDSEESLDEHLMSELRLSGIEGRERELCERIIGELDGDGRFVGSIPDLMMVTGADERELESARRRVMEFDPLGCAARDLAECFLAQISLVPSAKRAIFEQEVAGIASGRVSEEILPILRKLDPFPGRRYAPGGIRYVEADIFVDEDGEVTVENPELPEIRVSPKYIEMSKDRSLDEETRAYAAERVKRAREFSVAMEKRLEMISRVAEIAVSSQREALVKGLSAMKPLTMSEVAKKAKCSVATVSRAAARKYVKTPFGTVPLAKFFRRTDASVMSMLKRIVESAGDKGLSDRLIAEQMAKQGCKIARRTVAKYRAKLGLAAAGR